MPRSRVRTKAQHFEAPCRAQPERLENHLRSGAEPVGQNGPPACIFNALRGIAHAPVQQSSARSAIFIVKSSREQQAPLGAARYAGAATSGHMPLLTELEKSSVGRRFYKYAAPNGALAGGADCQIFGPPRPVGAFKLGRRRALCPQCCSGSAIYKECMK